MARFDVRILTISRHIVVISTVLPNRTLDQSDTTFRIAGPGMLAPQSPDGASGDQIRNGYSCQRIQAGIDCNTEVSERHGWSSGRRAGDRAAHDEIDRPDLAARPALQPGHARRQPFGDALRRPSGSTSASSSAAPESSPASDSGRRRHGRSATGRAGMSRPSSRAARTMPSAMIMRGADDRRRRLGLLEQARAAPR